MPVDYTYTGIENANDIISEKAIQPSAIETIDFALYNFLTEELKINASTNDGWKKVPVIWASAERAYQAKNNKELRDADGTLIFPLITVERTSIVKDLSKKGSHFGGTPIDIHPRHGSRITVARKIVQDKTRDFAVADSRRKLGQLETHGGVVGGGQDNFPDRKNYNNGELTGLHDSRTRRRNKKIVYETITMPAPVYVSVSYTVILRGSYQQQLNDMIAPFITLGGHINSFNIRQDGHKYETFVNSNFESSNNVSSLESEERIYQTTVQFEVLGYLIGEGKNSERPKVVKKQNAVEVKIPRERVILGDIPEHIDKRGFYRE
jgi:hypothetical protein